MSDEFRRGAWDDIARLLEHWRTVELWVKKAEQVNKKAVIPAINELRYASRQLFNALRVFEKPALSPGDKSTVSKRIIIAEQYLFNAEHDVLDAIVGFYDVIIEELDSNFGAAAITIFFPEYPLLKRAVQNSRELIADARHDYEKRGENYRKIRDEHSSYMFDYYKKLLDAEVNATHEREKLNTELVRAKAKIRLFEIVALLGGLASIIAIPLSIYLWTFAHDSYCQAHGKNRILGIICGISIEPSPAANSPSTGD